MYYTNLEIIDLLVSVLSGDGEVLEYQILLTFVNPVVKVASSIH